MKRNTMSAAAFALAIILLTWLGPAGINIAWGQGTAARIHLLVVADTNDRRIGESVKADLKTIQEVFRANVPAGQLHVETLSGGQVGRQSILSTIRRLTIQPSRDTVVFYFCGHGGFDEQNREHVLAPRQQALSMQDVTAAMRQLRPRLAVAITDTCSEVIRGRYAAPLYPPATRISEAFASLFVNPTGLIIISSTEPGQLAMGGPNGGFFTFALFAHLQRNQNRTLVWSDVLGDINDAVENEHAKDTRQTAYIVAQSDGDASAPPPAAADNVALPPGRTPFGITADRTARSAQWDGVEVLRVEPNSPATSLRGSDGKKHYLVPGRDVITHVNGSGVTTNAEVVAAVKSSPAKMVVRVYDTQTGTSGDYDVDLSGLRQSGRIRFGVTAAQTVRSRRIGGAEVTLVMPGYPGTRLRGRDGKQYYLVPGRDFITHINGQAVTTYDEFARAIDASPTTMVIRVHDSRTRSANDYEVTLGE